MQGCSERPFDDYASQRTAALRLLAEDTVWAFFVDADERVPVDLSAEVQTVVSAAPPDLTLFFMRRRDHFGGRWLRRASGYPTWFGRLGRVGAFRIERSINEQYVTSGSSGYLKCHLDHFPFSKGISWWVERHNSYSSMEAGLFETGPLHPPTPQWALTRDPQGRRASLKALAYRLPGRPLLAFFYLYVLRAGFLDGSAGLKYCILRSVYEYFVDLKVWEAKQRRLGLPL